MVLEARKDLPANTIPEFVALLKANGAKMQYGSAGAGTTTHLACSLLNSRSASTSRMFPIAARRRLERPDRRAYRLPVRQPRRGGTADRRQAGESDRGAVEGALAADAGPCDRARAGADRISMSPPGPRFSCPRAHRGRSSTSSTRSRTRRWRRPRSRAGCSRSA